MKMRPILFSASMVQVLLAGRKTQTRRLVKQPPNLSHLIWPDEWIPSLSPIPCPYGQPGDRLWVRETWRTAKDLDDLSPSAMAKKAKEAGWDTPWCPIEYVADGRRENWANAWGEVGKTRVSIHMPRWASRLTLEVTEVRVQHLQEMTAADVRAEGLDVPDDPVAALTAFADLWTSINGTWDCRAWVWAISFRVVPQNVPD